MVVAEDRAFRHTETRDMEVPVFGEDLSRPPGHPARVDGAVVRTRQTCVSFDAIGAAASQCHVRSGHVRGTVPGTCLLRARWWGRAVRPPGLRRGLVARPPS